MIVLLRKKHHQRENQKAYIKKKENTSKGI